jgi:hypothetical protein
MMMVPVGVLQAKHSLQPSVPSLVLSNSMVSTPLNSRCGDR